MALNARWLGVAASLVWIVAAALLASRNETWIRVWRLYCYLTADAACRDMVYIVMHWSAIATLMLTPIILGWLVGWGIVALRRRSQS
jgi:hypothetical protein